MSCEGGFPHVLGGTSAPRAGSLPWASRDRGREEWRGGALSSQSGLVSAGWEAGLAPLQPPRAGVPGQPAWVWAELLGFGAWL